MGIKKIEIEVLIKNKLTEFSEIDSDLIKVAKDAGKHAYAPYSQFLVGAAILLDNGKIVTGNNQENAAYPSSMCAERVAIFGAMANYPTAKVLTIAINASAINYVLSKPITPCGGCRQVINEYENKQKQPIKLILSGDSEEYWVIKSIKDLLPLSFGAENLKGK